MIKQELRQSYRDKRKAIPETERTRMDDLLLIRFQEAELPFIQTLFSYWPIEENKEPNTHLFTDYLEFKNPGLTLAYPRVDTLLDEMIAVIVHPETDFIKNDMHIYEPAEGDLLPADEIDMVLVPLLAIDKNGYRVGYGKGYYDKFLAESKKDCLKIGFSYFEPVEAITDKEQFDVPLDLCITPQHIYVFK